MYHNNTRLMLGVREAEYQQHYSLWKEKRYQDREINN